MAQGTKSFLSDKFFLMLRRLSINEPIITDKINPNTIMPININKTNIPLTFYSPFLLFLYF